MNKYNANVRIGNWYDELMLQEEKTKQFMRRSKNSELKVGKARKLFLNLLKEIPLTFPVVGLSYGAVIQIVSPEMPTQSKFGLKEKQGIALAANINYTNLDRRCNFSRNDPVIGTGLMTSCARNVWTLVPEDESQQGKELRFGDSFFIKLYSSDPPLYVHCLTQAPTSPTGECGYVVPTLSRTKNTLTRFKVVHLYEKLRFETTGNVVPPFEKVAILQAANSASLAVEPETWIPTYFGMECEVSLHTYKNPTARTEPDPRNFWSFILAS